MIVMIMMITKRELTNSLGNWNHDHWKGRVQEAGHVHPDQEEDLVHQCIIEDVQDHLGNMIINTIEQDQGPDQDLDPDQGQSQDLEEGPGPGPGPGPDLDHLKRN